MRKGKLLLIFAATEYEQCNEFPNKPSQISVTFSMCNCALNVTRVENADSRSVLQGEWAVNSRGLEDHVVRATLSGLRQRRVREAEVQTQVGYVARIVKVLNQQHLSLVHT